MVTVACPSCAKRLKAPDEAIGKKAKCTNCGRSFVLSATPPLPSVEPAAIVLEPVDAPKATRVPRWAVVAICCGGGVVLLVLVALVFTRRNVPELPQTSGARPALAAGAQPSQKPAASPPSPPLEAGAPESPAPTGEAPKTPEAELERFAKLPTDKALQVYFQALRQEVDMESEREALRDKARQAYLKEYEALFASRIPKDLEDAFKRMTDRSVRRKRVLEIAKMQGPERAAALAKDSAEERRIWKLRQQFREERHSNEAGYAGFANFVNTNKESGQRLKTLQSKLQELQTKIDKSEVNLFPRLAHEQIVEARIFVHVDLRVDEDRLEELKKKFDEVSLAAVEKEIESRTPPELEAALRRENDSAVRSKREEEIANLPSSGEREAAQQKDAEEERRMQVSWAVISEEIASMGGPLAVQVLDLVPTDLKYKCECQEKKCARGRARSNKLEEYLNASFRR
jgi:hypothetical protein